MLTESALRDLVATARDRHRADGVPRSLRPAGRQALHGRLLLRRRARPRHARLRLPARLRHGDGSGAGLPLHVVGEGLRRRALRARPRPRCAAPPGSSARRWCSATSTRSRGEALVAVAPRTILKRQLERAAAAGYAAMGASELEFFILRETYETAQQKGFDRLDDRRLVHRGLPHAAGLRRSSRWSAPSAATPTTPACRSSPRRANGDPASRRSTCTTPTLLEMADRHVVYKQAAKEIAIQNGLAVTFMAKFDEQLAGSSMHLHSSLWRDGGATRRVRRRRRRAPGALPDLCRWWLGGLMQHARACTLLFAPYVNSYKRFRAGSFAPTAIAWAFDNRTAGFRIVGSGSSLRVECRIPGADANPVPRLCRDARRRPRRHRQAHRAAAALRRRRLRRRRSAARAGDAARGDRRVRGVGALPRGVRRRGGRAPGPLRAHRAAQVRRDGHDVGAPAVPGARMTQH